MEGYEQYTEFVDPVLGGEFIIDGENIRTPWGDVWTPADPWYESEREKFECAKRGGHGKIQPDGSVHWTLWRNNGGKGERLSWDQVGRVIEQLHHTNQNTGKHSSNPLDWRKK